MQARRKIAVAGATGRLGRRVVEVLAGDGHDVVAMSRATGVDIVTGEGLAAALPGVECIIDAATGPSPTSRRPPSSSPARPATSTRPGTGSA